MTYTKHVTQKPKNEVTESAMLVRQSPAVSLKHPKFRYIDQPEEDLVLPPWMKDSYVRMETYKPPPRPKPHPKAKRPAHKQPVPILEWMKKNQMVPPSQNPYKFDWDDPYGLRKNEVKDNVLASLKEARVRAFLRMIRVGEGTVGESGYEKLFGGESFIKDYDRDFSTHPQIKITKMTKKGPLPSSAAGAYQIMGYTYLFLKGVYIKNRKPTDIYQPWHDYIRKYKIKDFTPESQDLLAIIILLHLRPGSLKQIMDGNVLSAFDMTYQEWASLPNSSGVGNYDQPTQKLQKAIDRYNEYLRQELEGTTDLHLPHNFLSLFDIK